MQVQHDHIRGKIAMDFSNGNKASASVLYVEDDKTTRDCVTIMLKRKFPQLTLFLAENGRTGLELYTDYHPDILITDVLMPEMDGISMSRAIKKLDRGARIILLTAASDTANVIDAIDIGISHYVLKPVAMEKLIYAIEHCLEGIWLEKKIRKQGEDIRQMAYYDPLTGLPNRELFNELLHQALAQAQRNNHDRFLAVLFLDLDRFKVINDTLGHSVGDQLLKAVAQRLKECCRRDLDTVARRGGDEFIILLPDLNTTQEAVRVANKIIDAFAHPLTLPEHELFISTCIGISIFPNDGADGDTLIRNADMAMYRAKENGRNRYHLYNLSMDAQAARRLALETNLRKALERGEFFLNYQPKVNVITGQVVSFEALVRWQNPELGLVEPMQFIPLAEETGLIVPLGEWVLRTACAQNKAWQDAKYPHLRVAVNFSPRQFQILRLADMVENVLSETNLDPCWLELEVTEGIMLQNVENTITTLRRLSDVGVHISIDDFGVGYSSISYIKKLPINTLKIDQSFISDIMSNPDDAAIATAVINLAHCLRLNVTAEGVENEDQANLLRSLRCYEMQGFFFSRPLSAEKFTLLLRKLRWQARFRNTAQNMEAVNKDNGRIDYL
jgi:diguanylate cyclase (GGDEF)-like protein